MLLIWHKAALTAGAVYTVAVAVAVVRTCLTSCLLYLSFQTYIFSDTNDDTLNKSTGEVITGTYIMVHCYFLLCFICCVSFDQ